MTWQYPWVIGGLTEIPLEVARVMAYAATGGNDGVIGSSDLKVTAQLAPNNTVIVAAGAFACLNRFSGATSQSYIGYNIGTDTKTITAAGAGGRTDLVYAHITDPTQPGQPTTPAQVQTRVIEGVASTVTRVQDVPGYTSVTGLALARITIPASTSTITDSMITDLRHVAVPHRESEVRTSTGTSGGTTQTVTSAYTTFPNLATWSISVPSWATRMTITATLVSLTLSGSALEFQGNVRVRAGASTVTPYTYINESVSGGTADHYFTIVAGDIAIPSSMRGTSQIFLIEALRSGGAANLQATQGATAVLQVTFYNATE